MQRSAGLMSASGMVSLCAILPQSWMYAGFWELTGPFKTPSTFGFLFFFVGGGTGALSLVSIMSSGQSRDAGKFPVNE
jgi:hypothetical protein